MAITDNLRRQHGEILIIIKEITDAMKSGPSLIEQFSELLPKLAGKINIHLAMEDNVLYPKMLASDDAKVRQTATDFLNEMGNLKETFGAYLKRWNSILKIQAQYEEFRLDTQGISKALSQRVIREDRELYDLADKRV